MTEAQRTSENPLGVRLTLSKSVTRKVGRGKDDWDKTIVTVESDKPSGLDVVQALASLSESLDSFLSQVKTPSPERLPQQPETSQSPTLIDVAPLDPLWKSNSKGGAWIFSEKAPELKRLLEQSPKHTVEINGQIYKLSGDNLQFVNRWGSRKP
jgi:hypothetical protein